MSCLFGGHSSNDAVPEVENVQVVIRVRPLNARERLSNAQQVVVPLADGRSLALPPDRTFTFDRVFAGALSGDAFCRNSEAAAAAAAKAGSSECEQREIFVESIRPMLPGLLRHGLNVTVLAYGQTGSGKTHTMGTAFAPFAPGSEQKGEAEEQAGVIPRTVWEIVRMLYAEAASDGTAVDSEVYVSFLELLNEDLRDLLVGGSGSTASSRPRITIRQDPLGEIFLTGLHEERIRLQDARGTEGAVAEILACLHRGSLSRTTRTTAMNATSSRSHAIFSLAIRQPRRASLFPLAKIHFVDLAGSERVKRAQRDIPMAASRSTLLRESISINSGLLALGNVISALTTFNAAVNGQPQPQQMQPQQQQHVPYRDSKLTRLLADALGGKARCLMIACISPSDADLGESLCTLRYAHRAKSIRNAPQASPPSSSSSHSLHEALFEIVQLRKEVASLKSRLHSTSSLGGTQQQHQHQHQHLSVVSFDFASSEALDALEEALSISFPDAADLLERVRGEHRGRLEALSQEHTRQMHALESRYEDQMALQRSTLQSIARERDEALSRLASSHGSNPRSSSMKGNPGKRPSAIPSNANSHANNGATTESRNSRHNLYALLRAIRNSNSEDAPKKRSVIDSDDVPMTAITRSESNSHDMQVDEGLDGESSKRRPLGKRQVSFASGPPTLHLIPPHSAANPASSSLGPPSRNTQHRTSSLFARSNRSSTRGRE